MNVTSKVAWVMSTWIVNMVVYSIPAVGVMLTNRVIPDFFVWFSLTFVFIGCWKTRKQLFKVIKGQELWQIADHLPPTDMVEQPDPNTLEKL